MKRKDKKSIKEHFDKIQDKVKQLDSISKNNINKLKSINKKCNEISERIRSLDD